MATNLCSCGVESPVLYIRLQYHCKKFKRWLCQVCLGKYIFKNNVIEWQKGIKYASQLDALAKLDKDVEKLKLNRQSLLKHLHKIFDQYPFLQNQKIQYSQEINQINSMFFNLINDPFNHKDLRELDEIHNSIRDRFNQLTEQEIQRFLSIENGCYQLDNSEIKQILYIMRNIDDIKSSNLVISLKLIAKKHEIILFYEQELENPKISIRYINNKFLHYSFWDYSHYPIQKSYIYDFSNKQLNQVKNDVKYIHNFHSAIFRLHQFDDKICIDSVNGTKLNFKFFINTSDYLMIQKISKSFFIFREEKQQKMNFFWYRSKKIIRILKFPSFQTFEGYNPKNNLLVIFMDELICFHNFSNLKLQYFIRLERKFSLMQVNLFYSINKLFYLIDGNLHIYDILPKSNCIGNLQILDQYEIIQYYLENENNYIIVFTLDKIIILDQYLFELKQMDFQTKFVFNFQINDMKYIYISQNIQGKLTIQQISLTD